MLPALQRAYAPRQRDLDARVDAIVFKPFLREHVM
jgi:hypothetical protein